MKADHATWETGLVIPEPVKSEGQQLLEAFLRVEALLVQLLGKPELIAVSKDAAELVEEAAKPKKGKAK